MENSESSRESSPISCQYNKRDAVARLFHLDVSQHLNLVNLDHTQVEQAFKPNTVDFTQGKKKDLKEDQYFQDSDLRSEECEEGFGRLCNLPEKRVSPIWIATPLARTGEILEQSSSHSNVQGKESSSCDLKPMKRRETARMIPQRNHRDLFSYTDSEYFHFQEPRDLFSPDETSIKESNYNNSNNPSQFLNQDNRVGNSLSECSGKGNTRKSPSSTKIVIVLLCLSLMVSLYFALFGSPVSFRNFFNSLTEERKQELSKELRVKYMSLPETALKPKVEAKKVSTLDGINYSPEGSNEPSCMFSKEQAIRDVALLSTIALKIRTYGTQCSQVENILHAIRVLELDTKLAMGVWLSSDDHQNWKQISKAKQILRSSFISPIESIFIGNEVIKRGDLSEEAVIFFIQEMKTFMSENGLKIKVGTSESPSFASQALVDSSDIFGFTIHPFLAGIPASDAAQWSLDRFIGLEKQFDNGKTKFTITELGWPYNGGHFKKAKASPSEFQIFMGSWIEKISKHFLSEWYLFEAFNEPWKARFNTEPNNWEAEWGLFDDEKKLRIDIEDTDDDQR